MFPKDKTLQKFTSSILSMMVRPGNLFYHTPDKMKQPSVRPNETSIIEFPNVRMLAMHRTSDKTNLYNSFSKAGGKTWSYPTDTGIWRYPPALTVLPDGRVFCIYGYRPAPMGISACVSYDNGNS